MGLYLSTDAGEQYPLATVAGWGLVGEWADRLDPAACPQAVHLWEHGWCQDVPALLSELGTAAPPHDRNAAHTLDALKETLRALPADAAVVVSDGLSPDATPAKEDRSGLVKKTITDHTGKKTTVYVRPGEDEPGGKDAGKGGPAADPKLAQHAASELPDLPEEARKNPGLMAKLGDALITVAHKVRSFTLTEGILLAHKVLDELLDTPTDLTTKFGYNPSAVTQQSNPNQDAVRGATGISTHLACSIASHVLARLYVAAKKKLKGGPKGEAVETPDWGGLAKLMCEVFAAVNEAMGLEGVPDAADVAAKLEEMAG